MNTLAHYFGSVDTSLFHIKREDDHLYFSKIYPEIKVSWQLNSAGRIQRITGKKTKLSPKQMNKLFVTLVSIDGHMDREKEKAWWTGAATLFPLPRELYSINWKFASQSYHEQYYSLFTFGHQMVCGCFTGIVQGITQPRHGPKKNPCEQPLSDIKRGMLEYAILEQAAALVPRALIDVIKHTASVRYEVFNAEKRQS